MPKDERTPQQKIWLPFHLGLCLKSRLCVSLLRDWRAGLEVLKCDPANLSFGSILPGSLRILIVDSVELNFGNSRWLPQLCNALCGLPALERFSLIGQELELHLVPLLAALQHCTLLVHLDIRYCILTRLPEG